MIKFLSAEDMKVRGQFLHQICKYIFLVLSCNLKFFYFCVVMCKLIKLDLCTSESNRLTFDLFYLFETARSGFLFIILKK